MVIQPIPQEHFSRVRELFASLTIHLAVEAVLAGAAPGKVWVDNFEHPRAGLMQVHHRFYLSGDPRAAQFAGELNSLFFEEIFLAGRAAGEEAFSLYYSDGWETVIQDRILQEVAPIFGERQYYEHSGAFDYSAPAMDNDLWLVNVDCALVNDETLTNRDALMEEMQSERSSVEAFLQSSFGLCVRSKDQIVTWCLSEYNLKDRCEVGIATDPAYRMRGLAAITGAAFLKQARSRGFERVGWHCWASNEGSWRTALRIGFEKKYDYPSYLVFFQPSLHFAVMGDISLNQGRYREALDQAERSMLSGDGPGWVYLNAACAAARLGQTSKAFEYLEAAAQHGFNNAQRLLEIDHLNALHGMPAWHDFLQKLSSE